MTTTNKTRKFYALQLSPRGDSIYVFESKSDRDLWVSRDRARMPVSARELSAEDRANLADPEYYYDHCNGLQQEM